MVEKALVPEKQYTHKLITTHLKLYKHISYGFNPTMIFFFGKRLNLNE
jgi:hypothetical protein